MPKLQRRLIGKRNGLGTVGKGDQPNKKKVVTSDSVGALRKEILHARSLYDSCMLRKPICDVHCAWIIAVVMMVEVQFNISVYEKKIDSVAAAVLVKIFDYFAHQAALNKYNAQENKVSAFLLALRVDPSQAPEDRDAANCLIKSANTLTDDCTRMAGPEKGSAVLVELLGLCDQYNARVQITAYREVFKTADKALKSMQRKAEASRKGVFGADVQVYACVDLQAAENKIAKLDKAITKAHDKISKVAALEEGQAQDVAAIVTTVGGEVDDLIKQLDGMKEKAAKAQAAAAAKAAAQAAAAAAAQALTVAAEAEAKRKAAQEAKAAADARAAAKAAKAQAAAAQAATYATEAAKAASQAKSKAAQEAKAARAAAKAAAEAKAVATCLAKIVIEIEDDAAKAAAAKAAGAAQAAEAEAKAVATCLAKIVIEIEDDAAKAQAAAQAAAVKSVAKAAVEAAVEAAAKAAAEVTKAAAAAEQQPPQAETFYTPDGDICIVASGAVLGEIYISDGDPGDEPKSVAIISCWQYTAGYSFAFGVDNNIYTYDDPNEKWSLHYKPPTGVGCGKEVVKVPPPPTSKSEYMLRLQDGNGEERKYPVHVWKHTDLFNGTDKYTATLDIKDLFTDLASREGHIDVTESKAHPGEFDPLGTSNYPEITTHSDDGTPFRFDLRAPADADAEENTAVTLGT